VNENLLSVPDGACSDSFTTPYFYRIIENPWGSLTESYYTCYMHPYDAFVNAIGVGLGNAGSLFIP